MSLSGNKGNWSEIYTFLKLLADGKLYAANQNLEKIEEIYYPILKIIRSELNNNKEYILNGNVKIYDSDYNKIILEIPIDKFITHSKILFTNIKKSKGLSFTLNETESFLKEIQINSFSSKENQKKSDINILVHDLNTGLKPNLRFSIKSLLGGKPTLFNPSSGTNFIYEVILKNKQNFDIDLFNKETYTDSRIQKRLEILIQQNNELRFSQIQSDNFQLNLELIDSQLPLIISYLVLYKYYYGKSKIKDLIDLLTEKNPLNYNLKQNHPFYEYKIKNMLTDMALGMTPENVWNGKYDATGGIIFVKDSGDLVCYHIYNKNEFQDYLILNTKLDQASTSEDENNPGHERIDKNSKPYRFGWLYKENNSIFIKLNLQIRFI